MNNYLDVFGINSSNVPLALALGESSDSAIHTVYERIKGIKGYKMT